MVRWQIGEFPGFDLNAPPLPLAAFPHCPYLPALLSSPRRAGDPDFSPLYPSGNPHSLYPCSSRSNPSRHRSLPALPASRAPAGSADLAGVGWGRAVFRPWLAPAAVASAGGQRGGRVLAAAAGASAGCWLLRPSGERKL